MNLLPYILIPLTLIILAILAAIIFSPGGPWLPASRKDIRQMLKMAALQPGETLYDLGSGDGRVLFIAAREFGANAVGIEIDPLRCAWSRLLCKLQRLDSQVTIHRASFFDLDLSSADVVTAFLLQRINNRLVHKLTQDLRPGTRVVAHTFIFPGWPPAERDPHLQLTLYRIGDTKD